MNAVPGVVVNGAGAVVLAEGVDVEGVETALGVSGLLKSNPPNGLGPDVAFSPVGFSIYTYYMIMLVRKV